VSRAALPSSFDGWPATKLVRDPSSDKPGVEIQDDYLSPEGAKGSFRTTLIICLVFGADLAVMATGNVPQDFFVMCALVFPAFVLLTRWFVRWIYTRRLRIRVYHDRILVSGWRGDDEYPTNMDIEFELQAHEKTLEEEASRKANPHAAYFNNSAEAVMKHSHQPVVLATIYPKAKAQRLIARVAGALEGLKMNSFGSR